MLILANHSVTTSNAAFSNGSFESGAFLSASTAERPFAHYEMDNWTATVNGAGFATALATNGARVAIFNGNSETFGGTVSQTFETVSGQTYQLQFDAGVVGNGADSQLLGVDVTGDGAVSLLTDEVTLTSATGSMVWTPSTIYSFTANGTATTLTFTDKSGTLVSTDPAGSDLLLDHVRVTLVAANTAPVADNDSYAATVDTPLMVDAASGVLAGDTDGEANTLTAVIVAGPTSGTLTVFNTDGSFTYTPNSGFTGTDSFTYKANDGLLDSNVATVTITVNPAALAPFSNGSFEAGAFLSASTAERPFAHYEMDNWTATVNGAGFVTGLATNGARVAIFNGSTETFGGTVSQTFETVSGQTYQLQFDAGVVGNGADSQLLGVDVTGDGAVSLLTDEVTLTSATGSMVWTPSTIYTFTANGTATTLTFTDKSGTLVSTDPAGSDLLLDHVRVTLVAANTAPVADNDSYAATEDTPLMVDAASGVLAGDTDGEANTLTAVIVAGPTSGTLTVFNTDGSFTYTPNSGFTGTDSFTYKANDGLLDSNVATVTITVNPAALAPFSNGSFELGAFLSASTAERPFAHYEMDNWTATVNGAGFVTGLATNGARVAIFNGSTETFGGTVSQTFETVSGQTYQLQFDAGVVGNGADSQLLGVDVTGDGAVSLLTDEVTLTSATGSMVWTPSTVYTFTANGTATTLTFTDKSGTLVSTDPAGSDLLLDHVRVTLVAANTAPVADNDSYAATEDTPFVVDAASGVLAGDTDGEANTLTAVIVAGPTSGTLTVFNTDGSFTYTPNSGFTGTDSFTYKANDGLLDSNVATVTITVNPATLSPFSNGSFELGAFLSASTAERPFAHYEMDNWTTTVNGAGFVTGLATNGARVAIFNGSTETFGGTVSQTFETVSGQTYQLQFDAGVVGNGADSQLLGVDVTGDGAVSLLTDEVTLTSATGSMVWTPSTIYSFTANGTATTLTFTDKSGTLVSTDPAGSDVLLDHVRVTLASSNTAPVAVDDSFFASESTPLVIDSPGVLDGDTDGQLNALTAVLVAGPSHGGLALNPDGGFTYTPGTGYAGTDSFTYKANDGLLDSNVATVTITVNATGPSLLTNGSFELGAPVAAFPAVNFSHYQLDDWSATGNAVGYLQSPPSVTAVDGARVAIFNGGSEDFGGTVSQTITTISGAVYQLQFHAGVVGSTGSNQVLGVSVNNGLQLSSNVSLTAPSGGVTQWTPKSYLFTAAGASTTVAFTDNSGAPAAGSDLLLDRVRVVLISLPNTPPVANAQSVSVDQADTIAITLTGSDLDNDGLSFAVASGPGHGSLSLTGAVAIYTPDTNYTGADSFTFTANDGEDNSTPATVSITVNPAVPSLLLNGSFETGNLITAVPFNQYHLDNWTVFGNPVGFERVLPSVPASHLLRMAIFNGGNEVFGGTVSQTFVTDPGQTYQLKFDAGIAATSAGLKQLLGVALTGGSSLSEDVLLTSPTGGAAQWTAKKYWFTATGTSTTLTFTDKSALLAPGAPAGSDLLLDQTKVQVYSQPNTPPVAVAQAVSVNEDAAATIVLTGTDVDGDNTLSYAVQSSPLHGLLTGSVSNPIYTPFPDYNGQDSFTFTASDGTGTSTAATVSITVVPVNDAPSANAQSVSVDEDAPLEITLTASDLENNSVTFALADAPDNGEVSISGAVATYTPDPDYNGPDSFTFTASDGMATSAAATVSITVDPVNDAPVATGQTFSMVGGTSAAVVLSATDLESDPLIFSVATPPSHGTISGTPPNLIYTPVRNYVGTDSFTFIASDASEGSLPATVSITITDALLNGSFEQVSGLVPNHWTATGPYLIATSSSVYPPKVGNGNSVAVFSPGSNLPGAVLSQTFATSPGQPYVLSFDLGIIGGIATGTQTISATITGTTAPFSKSETITPDGTVKWDLQRPIRISSPAAPVLP